MPQRPVIAWSFSTLDAYENCPRKVWATKVEKLVSDVNQFNAEGDDHHKTFEYYLKNRADLPPNLQHFRPMLDRVKATPGELYTEFKMTLDTDYNPCGWSEWERAWVRGMSDVLIVNNDKAKYIDWKFGKVKDDERQPMLTAALVFQHFPQVQQVDSALVFAKHQKIVPYRHTRAQVPELWAKFLPTVQKLTQSKINNEWPARPNPLCAYCPYLACPHNKNAKQP